MHTCHHGSLKNNNHSVARFEIPTVLCCALCDCRNPVKKKKNEQIKAGAYKRKYANTQEAINHGKDSRISYAISLRESFCKSFQLIC
ncbi:MAG: hypothetical protein IPL12_20575 [Bacteroidetes bacterium]|nr:hypothetical protein [Bacteroidota bacterium]